MSFAILIQIFFLGLGLSADALSVALTDGLVYQDINKKKSFFIAFVFGFMQALMPLIGFWLVELVEVIVGENALLRIFFFAFPLYFGGANVGQNGKMKVASASFSSTCDF